MIHITVNGNDITLSDIRPVCNRTYLDGTYTVEIVCSANKPLTSYEKECIGKEFAKRIREGEEE